MKRERMRLLALAAATVSAPGVIVHVGSAPSCGYTIEEYRRMPERGYMYFELTRNDRMIARRVNWYTGVPLGELLRLRRAGYGWFEIGRWLHMPRPAVRAAMGQKSWNRFIHGRHGHAAINGKHAYRVTYYDGREYRKK